MRLAAQPITRSSLADTAVEHLRAYILEGKLSSADTLTEPRLAELLGISRTPVREAIARLGREGLLVIDKRRGFRVAPVDEATIRHIYPIIAALEAMAVRLSASTPPDVAALRDINRQILSGKSRRVRLFELDREFHSLLVANCPNARLLGLLEEHRRLAGRFDGAARRGMHKPVKSGREHSLIVNDVARGRFESAARRIEQHYLEGIDTVIEWLALQSQGAVQ